MVQITWDTTTAVQCNITNSDYNVQGNSTNNYYSRAHSTQSWSGALDGTIIFQFPSWNSAPSVGIGKDPFYDGDGYSYPDIEIRFMWDTDGDTLYVKDGSDNSNLDTSTLGINGKLKLEGDGTGQITYFSQASGSTTWTQLYQHTVSQTGTWYVHTAPASASVTATYEANSGGGSGGGGSGGGSSEGEAPTGDGIPQTERLQILSTVVPR